MSPRMSRRPTRPLFATTSVFIALLVSACGGGGSQTGADPAAGSTTASATITNSGAEVTNPHRNVGRAIVLSIAICVVVYLLVAFAVGSSLPLDRIVAADALLDRFGLTDRAKDKLETLSLGNQQRVQIAAAVLYEPVGLILDEPFSGLDPDAVDEMHAVLTEFTSKGVPVLFSSHRLDLVERLCDDIVIIAGGKIVASGSVRELRDAGQTQHRIQCDADLGWLRDFPGVHVLDLDGTEAQVEFANDRVEQQVLQEALARGPVRAFGPTLRPLSHIYREVTR